MRREITLPELLDEPRSEVFAVDLHPHDVVVFFDPDEHGWAFQIADEPRPHPQAPETGVLLRWSRVLDLRAAELAEDERACELRAQGWAVAVDELHPLAFGTTADHVYEIVGKNIVR